MRLQEAMPRSRRQSLDKQQQQHAHSRLERVSAAASSAASDGKPRQHKSSLGPGSENDRRSNLGMAPATVAPQD